MKANDFWCDCRVREGLIGMGWAGLGRDKNDLDEREGDSLWLAREMAI